MEEAVAPEVAQAAPELVLALKEREEVVAEDQEQMM